VIHEINMCQIQHGALSEDSNDPHPLILHHSLLPLPFHCYAHYCGVAGREGEKESAHTWNLRDPISSESTNRAPSSRLAPLPPPSLHPPLGLLQQPQCVLLLTPRLDVRLVLKATRPGGRDIRMASGRALA
jgi:hypothetical protein